MKWLIGFLTLVVCLLPGVARANITTVNFDDLTTPLVSGGTSYGEVPCNYAGLTWSCSVLFNNDWEVISEAQYNAGGWPPSYITFPSEPNAAYNDSGGYSGGGVVSIGDGTTKFNFVSAQLLEWGAGYGTPYVTIKGYGFMAAPEYSETVAINTSTWVTDPVGWGPIDYLTFTPTNASGVPGMGYFLMDNFVYSPEPGTIALMLFMGARVAGLMRLRRRRN